MPPIMMSNAPHQMPACSSDKTTGCSDGLSNNDAPRISTPYTSSRAPMKNQIETIPSRCMVHLLPEYDLQNYEDHGYDSRPENGPLIHGEMAFRRDFGTTVDQVHELRF